MLGRQFNLFNTNKKGFFFTLSTYFMVSFFILVFFARATFDFDETIASDRIGDLSNSITSSIKEILYFYYDSLITITRGEDTVNVTFSEDISRDKDEWGEEFSEKIQNFQTFVEAEDPDVKLNISLLLDKELPLIISPYNISYSRSWATGHVILQISEEGTVGEGYELVINSGETEIDKVQSNFRQEGDFLFRVVASDNFGNNLVEQDEVDPSGNHQVQIFFAGGNKVVIDLRDDLLEIWTNNAEEISVTSTLIGLPATDERVRVDLFSGAVMVNMSSLGAERTASVSILEE